LHFLKRIEDYSVGSRCFECEFKPSFFSFLFIDGLFLRGYLLFMEDIWDTRFSHLFFFFFVKVIGFSLYNTFFFSAFLVVIFATAIPHDIKWIIGTISILVATFLSFGSLLFHKIYLLKRQRTSDIGESTELALKSSGKQRRATGASQSITTASEPKIDDETVSKEKYEALKAKYHALQEKYNQLKEMEP